MLVLILNIRIEDKLLGADHMRLLPHSNISKVIASIKVERKIQLIRCIFPREQINIRAEK